MVSGQRLTTLMRMSPILAVALFIVIIVTWIWCWWPLQKTTVYISRHGEKLNASLDTPLSADGRARADALAHVLSDEAVDAVFVTEFLRTQQTGAPTANQAGLTVITYGAGAPQDVVDMILSNHLGQKILVIGHSNTVDDIAAGLGAFGVAELAENQFDRLFAVHRIGSTVHLNRLRYGVETPQLEQERRILKWPANPLNAR